MTSRNNNSHCVPDANLDVGGVVVVGGDCAPLARQNSTASSASDDEFLYVSMTCGDCGDLFPTRKELLQHRVGVHTNRRPYQCPGCMATFGKAEMLRQHARTHTQDTPHACGQCSARFSLRSHVVAHARAVHRPAPRLHGCSLCPDKTFQSAARLAHHVRCHSKEKPYVCKICEKQFRYLSYLHRHQLTKNHDLPEVHDVKENSPVL